MQKQMVAIGSAIGSNRKFAIGALVAVVALGALLYGRAKEPDLEAETILQEDVTPEALPSPIAILEEREAKEQAAAVQAAQNAAPVQARPIQQTRPAVYVSAGGGQIPLPNVPNVRIPAAQQPVQAQPVPAQSLPQEAAPKEAAPQPKSAQENPETRISYFGGEEVTIK